MIEAKEFAKLCDSALWVCRDSSGERAVLVHKEESTFAFRAFFDFNLCKCVQGLTFNQSLDMLRSWLYEEDSYYDIEKEGCVL